MNIRSSIDNIHKKMYNIFMIKRKISDKAIYLSTKFPVVGILGPRQSGKTTLVKNIFSNKKYVSFEDIDIRNYADEDPRSFLAEYPDGAIYDEVQRVPELFSYIQTNVDNDVVNGKFILTGSNNFLLNESITQSLAGRIAILNLLPFSISELKNSGVNMDVYETYLYNGF